MNFIVQIRPVNPQKGICERRTRVAQQIFNTLRGDKIHVLLVCLSKRRKLSQKRHQSSCFSHHHHRSRLLNALIFPSSTVLLLPHGRLVAPVPSVIHVIMLLWCVSWTIHYPSVCLSVSPHCLSQVTSLVIFRLQRMTTVEADDDEGSRKHDWCR